MRHECKPHLLTIIKKVFLIAAIIPLILLLYVIDLKNMKEIHFGSDQAELYNTSAMIMKGKISLIGHPSVWGFNHPGPILRFYFNLIYILSFGNIFVFYLLDTVIKLILFTMITYRIKEYFNLSKIEFMAVIGLIVSSQYFIFLMKIPWSHGLVVIGILYMILCYLKSYKYQFLFVMNALVQINLVSLVPILFFLPFFISENFRWIKLKVMSITFIFIFFWILPIYESIKNKGGNLLLMFNFFNLDKNKNYDINNFEIVFQIINNWNVNKYVNILLFLGVLLLGIFCLSKNNAKSLVNTNKYFFISFSILFTSSLFSIFIGNREYYYFAYLYGFYFLLIILFLYNVDNRLRIVFTLLIICLTSMNMFVSYKKYSETDWNEFQYSEILDLSEKIKEYKKKDEKINLSIDGKFSGQLALSFLVVLERLGSKIDYMNKENEKIIIHTDLNKCEAITNPIYSNGKKFCFEAELHSRPHNKE